MPQDFPDRLIVYTTLDFSYILATLKMSGARYISSQNWFDIFPWLAGNTFFNRLESGGVQSVTAL